MPPRKTLLALLSTYLAGLYGYDALLGEHGAFAPTASAIVGHRWAGAADFLPAADVVRNPPDKTPATRVRDTFVMFVPPDDRNPSQPAAAGPRSQKLRDLLSAKDRIGIDVLRRVERGFAYEMLWKKSATGG